MNTEATRIRGEEAEILGRENSTMGKKRSYTRRQRRQNKMKLRGKFSVRHRLIAGRTGAVRHKQRHGALIERRKRDA